MTKEFSITNGEKPKHWPEAVLAFRLRYYLVIRVSTLAISSFRPLENIEKSQITL
jgi:hypothetical protein